MEYPDLIFISVFDKGCIDLALNHLISLKKADITNYMAHVTDRYSYTRLILEGYNVTLCGEDILGRTVGVNLEKKDFDTPDFNMLSYTRYAIISKLLREGKSVWYMDTDTVVLANLNKIYAELKKLNEDVIFQNDITMICTGCMLWFPSEKTISLCEEMYSIKNSDYCDQMVLAKNLPQLIERGYEFDTFFMNYFPNGFLYFDESDVNIMENLKKIKEKFKDEYKQEHVFFVHCNWMIGSETKINALKKKGLWYLK